MSWQYNAGHIGAGQSVRWSLWWGGDNHDYNGVQFIQARPLLSSSGGIEIIAPAELVVADPGVKTELNGGYTYTLTVTNRGPWDTDYELDGGEV